MTEIRVPKLNNNDESYTLIEWIIPSGSLVRRGDPVATVETSKAAEELPAAGEGYLHQLVPVGAACTAGALIGRLDAAPGSHQPPDLSEISDIVITEPALQAMAERGIDRAAVEALGRRVIRVADLDALADPAPVGEDRLADRGPVVEERLADRAPAPDERPAHLAPVVEEGLADRAPVGEERLAGPAPVPEEHLAGPASVLEDRLPAVQRAVAAVVTESWTIPQAFVAVRVPAEAAAARGRELTRTYRRMIGLPELTVAAIGAVAAEHPDCFAAFVPPDRVRRAEAIDIGVTVDVGQGLHVPVIRDVPALTLADIAGRLMQLRTTALRGTFRPADLAGPAILLALHTDPDVTAAVPLVLPGTTCAVSLTGRVDGHVQLGLAYDHRVLNGRGATLFLKAVAAQLTA